MQAIFMLLRCALCASLLPALYATAQDKTAAGTPVSNDATVDYQVDNIPQGQLTTNTASLTVDRLVDVVVTTPASTINVVPSQTPDIVYQVTNEGNDNQQYILNWVMNNGMAVSSVAATYYIDDGDGVFQDDGTDGAATAITVGEIGTASENTGGLTVDIAPGQIVWVVLTPTIDPSNPAGQPGELHLVADSHNPATSLDTGYGETPGNETTNATTNPDTGPADTVLADALFPPPT